MKCPNCGTERFKKGSKSLPKNVLLVGNVDAGDCSRCGTVVYATA